MVWQKHLSWWSLRRDKNRWEEQHFARTHLESPGNWSRSVEQFWNENAGARRNPRMYRCLCGDWGKRGSKRKQWTRVQLLSWDSSGTSLCVCVCIRPSWRLLADEEALHKNLRGARPQGSALSHADTSFSDSVELSPLSADHTHTHKQS